MPLLYTYTPDFTTQRDRVRLEIGDTTLSATSTFMLADQEIAQAGAVEGNDLSVAARCCEFLESKFAVKADLTEGKLSLKLSQRAKAYREKAKYLRSLAAMTGALPSIGGESISDKRTNDQDADRVPPAFWRGMNDSPDTQPLSPGSEDEPDPSDQSN